MPLTVKPMLCEICDKTKFLSSLKCSHQICLDCKISIAKAEHTAKCPYCRIPFKVHAKVIETREQFAKKIEEILCEVNWESCSIKTEYNSEPSFWRG